MSLLCTLGRHRPGPRPLWNDGYYFSTCKRCGRDLVRTPFERWSVPLGYRVVWSHTPPANRTTARLAPEAPQWLPPPGAPREEAPAARPESETAAPPVAQDAFDAPAAGTTAGAAASRSIFTWAEPQSAPPERPGSSAGEMIDEVLRLLREEDSRNEDRTPDAEGGTLAESPAPLPELVLTQVEPETEVDQPEADTPTASAEADDQAPLDKADGQTSHTNPLPRPTSGNASESEPDEDAIPLPAQEAPWRPAIERMDERERRRRIDRARSRRGLRVAIAAVTLAAALIVTSVSGFDFAPKTDEIEQPASARGFVAGALADCRAAPHPDAPPLRQLPRGTPVDVLEREGMWASVEHAAGQCWVEQRALDRGAPGGS